MILRLDFSNKIITIEDGMKLSELMNKMHELLPNEYNEWTIHPSYAPQQYIYPQWGGATDVTTNSF